MVELAKRYFLVIAAVIMMIGVIIFYVIIPSRNNEVQLLVNNEKNIVDQSSTSNSISLDEDNQGAEVYGSTTNGAHTCEFSRDYNNKLLQNTSPVNYQSKFLDYSLNISKDSIHLGTEEIKDSIDKVEISNIPVYICGEVKNPGVYEVQSNKLINDIVILAGGLTKDANDKAINLASEIHSNQMIVVPKLGEPIPEIPIEYNENAENDYVESNDVDYTSVSNTSQSLDNNYKSNLININTATKDLLMELPGIGEVKASEIIDYRESIGRFNDISDIKNVSGIGEKTFEKLAKLITV